MQAALFGGRRKRTWYQKMGNKRIIGFYDYTVILTYLGMITAFIGIIDAVNCRFTPSIICLMLAGVCDMFDGAVASTRIRNRYEKHFGIQIDSLCDLISFGLLPAVFVYMYSGKTGLVGFIACLYTLCALIRLAYFNVSEYERQSVSSGARETYLGLPVTTVALFLPLLYLICESSGSNIVFGILLFLLSIGFISGFEIKKPKLIGKIVVVAVGVIEALWVFVTSGVGIR